MLLSDLPKLINIIDEIIPEDSSVFFLEKEASDCIETCLQLMYEFVNDNPTAICEPDFYETMIENVKELFSVHFDFDNNILLNEEAEDDFDEIIDIAVDLFYLHFMPIRSYSDTFVIPKNKKQLTSISTQITILKNKPQPQQRTKEWYEFRNNLITASNAYKAFENQATRNQLIYEKCQSKSNYDEMAAATTTTTTAIATATATTTNHVNINSPLHWGQKYEPISVMYYENKYNTKVQDFGCIQHNKYSFIGASPDGIISDHTLPNYGRMLEIKNPISREIDGVPIKEYWIQMQLQMETCNLDECDFLETKFMEYESESDFKNDGEFFTSAKDEMKGIIMYFSDKDGNPSYLYKPLKMTEEYFGEVWEAEKMEEKDKQGYVWIKNIYWRLEEVSCVLVLRNNMWFHDNVDILKELWNIIEKERNDGYTHRAPNKRPKKIDVSISIPESDQECVDTGNMNNGCLLSMDKTSGKIGINVLAIPNFNNIIKIRTESIDETKIDM